MPMIASEFETATFQLEALSLKQLRHRVTPFFDIIIFINNLSNDRSKASSKTIPPLSAI
jgi:hypothetical protein